MRIVGVAMRERVERYWGGFFGLEPGELARPGVRVVAHCGLGDYRGAWIFWRGAAVIVSVPGELVAETRARFREAGSGWEPEGVAEWFADRTERRMGPAYQGYLDPTGFRPAGGSGVGVLSGAEGELEALRAACDPVEWSHAGIEAARPEPCFGCWHEGRLVAVAQNAFWAEGVVSPGLLVHAAYRGRGFGKAVLAAATAAALEHGHLPLYQTLESNRPAVRAAEALGYRPFARHLALRFRG